MSPTLPAPGTIWKHKITSRLMRAVIVTETAITAHNCELAMRDHNIPMASWSGPPENFARAFTPASATAYPPTA
jgi:hypothetical protein